MRKWSGTTPATPSGILRDDTISKGSVVAVLDKNTDTQYHIAKVIDITGTITTLWYAGTRGKNLKTAVWKFIYHTPGTAGTYQHTQPKCMNPEDFRFTGSIPTHDIHTGLIIETNLQTKTTKSGFRLGPISVSTLKKMSFKHHQLGRTWKFPGNHVSTV